MLIVRWKNGMHFFCHEEKTTILFTKLHMKSTREMCTNFKKKAQSNGFTDETNATNTFYAMNTLCAIFCTFIYGFSRTLSQTPIEIHREIFMILWRNYILPLIDWQINAQTNTHTNNNTQTKNCFMQMWHRLSLSFVAIGERFLFRSLSKQLFNPNSNSHFAA